MPTNNGSDEKQIAEEIINYLKSHPNAADTVEGITEWWLLRPQIEESISLVQKALDSLISKSVMKFKVNLSGKKVYSKLNLNKS